MSGLSTIHPSIQPTLHHLAPPHQHPLPYQSIPPSKLISQRKYPQGNTSKEIIPRAAPSAGDVALVVGHGREDGEAGAGVEAAVGRGGGHRHDGGHVAAAVAVVGGGPDGDDGFGGEVELFVVD